MGFEAIALRMLVLFLCMASGFAARKLKLMNDQLDSMLSKLVLSITLPCMIVAAVITRQSMPDPATIWTIFGFACAAYVIILAISLAVPSAFHLKPDKRGTYSFMMAFGNVGFIGYPVLNSIFGSQALLYGAIFNIPFNLLVFTVGIIMLSESEDSLRDQLRHSAKYLHSPTLIACFAALVLALLDVSNTGFIGETMDTLGSMTTPAALLIVGSSLAKMPARTMLTHVGPYIMATFRLLLIPLCVWLAFRNFVTDPLLLGVLVITSGMPVATNGTLLCLRYGGDLDTMLRGTFITTVLSMATIPLLATVII